MEDASNVSAARRSAQGPSEALTLTLKPQGRMRTGCRLAPPGRPARRCACWPWRPSLHPRRRRRLGHHRPGPGGELPLQGRATEEISGEDAVLLVFHRLAEMLGKGHGCGGGVGGGGKRWGERRGGVEGAQTGIIRNLATAFSRWKAAVSYHACASQKQPYPPR